MKKYFKLAGLLVGIALVIFLMTREFDLEKMIEAGGLLIIGATVFAETGLLIGFFLPGDTLLFAAGFFAAGGALNIYTTILVIIIAAIFGNMAGYEIGRRSGKYVFRKDDSIFFQKKYIDTSRDFFERHGGKTVMLARFVPIVRTLTPLLAGTAKMDYKKFMFYNVVGAIIWGTTVTLIGFWAGKVLGKYFEIDTYILPIILVATILTFGASFWHALKEPETRAALKKKIAYNYKTFFKSDK